MNDYSSTWFETFLRSVPKSHSDAEAAFLVRTATIERAGQRIVETKSMDGCRLSVHLDYEGGRTDEFNWELFTPKELAKRAAPFGLRLVETCSGYDETIPAAPDRPRFQAIFEKP